MVCVSSTWHSALCVNVLEVWPLFLLPFHRHCPYPDTRSSKQSFSHGWNTYLQAFAPAVPFPCNALPQPLCIGDPPACPSRLHPTGLPCLLNGLSSGYPWRPRAPRCRPSLCWAPRARSPTTPGALPSLSLPLTQHTSLPGFSSLEGTGCLHQALNLLSLVR